MIQLARKPVAIAFAETHIDEVLRTGARPPSMMMTHEQQRTPAPSLGKHSKPIRNHRRCSPFLFRISRAAHRQCGRRTCRVLGASCDLRWWRLRLVRSFPMHRKLASRSPRGGESVPVGKPLHIHRPGVRVRIGVPHDTWTSSLRKRGGSSRQRVDAGTRQEVLGCMSNNLPKAVGALVAAGPLS